MASEPKILYLCNGRAPCEGSSICMEDCNLTGKREYSLNWKDHEPDKEERKKKFKKYGKNIWIEK